MKKVYLIILPVIIAIFALSLIVLTSKNNQSANNVKTKSITIKASDINSEIDRSIYFYKFSNQNLKNYPSLGADAKNTVEERAIIESYAALNNIKVTQDEINKRYAQKTQVSGEQKLLEQLAKMYSMDKNNYLDVLKQDILREKIQLAVDKPLSAWLKEQKAGLKVIIN